MFTARTITFAVLIGTLTIATASGQSLQQRMEAVRRTNAAKAAAQRAKAHRTASTMQRGVPTVTLERVPARDAIAWISRASGVTIVVHWRKLETEYGIDPQQPVDVLGNNISAARALDLVLKQMTVDRPLVWEVTPWYVEVMSKDQADARTSILVYPIGDLITDIPNFNNAPDFDLTKITEGRQGDQANTSSLFDDITDTEVRQTPRERAERIAQLIRDTIEPNIWRANGGLYASISIYRDMLIIRAPMYVHRRIGHGTPPPGSRATNVAIPGAAMNLGATDAPRPPAAAPPAAYERRFVDIKSRSTNVKASHIRAIWPYQPPARTSPPESRDHSDVGIK